MTIKNQITIEIALLKMAALLEQQMIADKTAAEIALLKMAEPAALLAA